MPERRTIIRDRQLVIRREMDRRGISLKAVSLDSGISYDTIVSYFPGEAHRQPAEMPASVIYAICDTKALPLDLISLLLPDRFAIVHSPEGIDHDALCEAAADYVSTKIAAHHPESEAGRDIGPGERSRLDGKVVVLRGSVAA